MAALADEKLKLYSTNQAEIQKLFVQKQQALSQFNENTLVKGELDLLSGNTKVYKLVGPILVTVPLEESKDNVSKRLEFISAEVEKLERSTAVMVENQKKLGDEIAEIQQKMQAEAASAARNITGTIKS